MFLLSMWKSHQKDELLYRIVEEVTSIEKTTLRSVLGVRYSVVLVVLVDAATNISEYYYMHFFLL